jgi:hypothetical protein
LPPCAAATSTLRWRVWLPPPHVTEHACHASHADISQSTGHESVLHACVSSTAPHPVPPNCAATCVLRTRCCMPPPHVLEQSPHAPHCDCWQWMGHDIALQLCASVSCPQAFPPCSGCVVTMRARVCWPSPHVALHAAKPAHADNTQSTGQGSLLQLRVSTRAGHAVPPLATAAVTERERVCEPPPHVLVHDIHAEYVLTTQWTGHAPRSQVCVSTSAPQATPPHARAVSTVRERNFVPVAQVAEQAPQGVKVESAQSTGQQSSLHDCASVRCGQTVPA